MLELGPLQNWSNVIKGLNYPHKPYLSLWKKKINIIIQVFHTMTKLNHPLFYGIDVLHHLLSEEKLIEKIKDDEESKSHTLT